MTNQSRGPEPEPEPQPTDQTVPDDDTVFTELEDDLSPEIGDMLRAALAPTEDVRSRARAKVDRTLQDRSLTSTLADFAAIGPNTIWHLLTNTPEVADRRATLPDYRNRRRTEPGKPTIYEPSPTPEANHD